MDHQWAVVWQRRKSWLSLEHNNSDEDPVGQPWMVFEINYDYDKEMGQCMHGLGLRSDPLIHTLVSAYMIDDGFSMIHYYLISASNDILPPTQILFPQQMMTKLSLLSTSSIWTWEWQIWHCMQNYCRNKIWSVTLTAGHVWYFFFKKKYADPICDGAIRRRKNVNDPSWMLLYSINHERL